MIFNLCQIIYGTPCIFSLYVKVHVHQIQVLKTKDLSKINIFDNVIYLAPLLKLYIYVEK